MSDDNETPQVTQLTNQIARMNEALKKATQTPESGEPHCSFCGRSAQEVERLITGGDAHICNLCISMAHANIGNDSS